MNTRLKALQSVAAALAVLAGGIGCSHSEGTERFSSVEREAPPKSDRRMTEQNTSYATNAPVYTAPVQRDPVVVTTQAPPMANSNGPVYGRGAAPSTNNPHSTAQEQRDAVTVRASEAPPLTPAETPTHSASSEEFWVDGNWRFESGAYIWQPGHVEHFRSDQLYHPANWAASEGGWGFTPAYWQ